MSAARVAMRDAFGEALLSMAERRQEMVVLDADVSSSTKTGLFGKKYPKRFFNIGVAEANMADIAGGMATCGLRPVISTFAIFIALKCTEQIRSTMCYNKLSVIMVGGYAGVSDSFDGASHQALADVAIMRSLPNLTVMVPGDSVEVGQCLAAALGLDGPSYIRLSRNPTPILFEGEEEFRVGKIRRIAKGDDVTLVVCGVPTYLAIEAAEKLRAEGVSVDLLEVSTIKPLDVETLVGSVSRTKRILTVEEHTVLGGLGSATAEALGRECPTKIDCIGIEDRFTETGPYDDLLNKYGISVDNIVRRVRRLLG